MGVLPSVHRTIALRPSRRAEGESSVSGNVSRWLRAGIMVWRASEPPTISCSRCLGQRPDAFKSTEVCATGRNADATHSSPYSPAPFSQRRRSRSRPSIPRVKLTDAAGWFDGEYRETSAARRRWAVFSQPMRTGKAVARSATSDAQPGRGRPRRLALPARPAQARATTEMVSSDHLRGRATCAWRICGAAT